MPDAVESRDLPILIRQARAGEAGAFDGLARHCLPLIRRWALVGTGDPDDADEVTQTVLIRLHRALGGFRGDARFTTWLYRLTHNAVTDALRRRTRRERRTAPLEEFDGATSPTEGADARMEAAEAAAIVGSFFAELPARQREVFDLVDLQGYTIAEAAEMLGIEAVTARVHLLRARRTLRTRVLDAHPETGEMGS